MNTCPGRRCCPAGWGFLWLSERSPPRQRSPSDNPGTSRRRRPEQQEPDVHRLTSPCRGTDLQGPPKTEPDLKMDVDKKGEGVRGETGNRKGRLCPVNLDSRFQEQQRKVPATVQTTTTVVSTHTLMSCRQFHQRPLLKRKHVWSWIRPQTPPPPGPTSSQLMSERQVESSGTSNN